MLNNIIVFSENDMNLLDHIKEKYTPNNYSYNMVRNISIIQNEYVLEGIISFGEYNFCEICIDKYIFHLFKIDDAYLISCDCMNNLGESNYIITNGAYEIVNIIDDILNRT